MDPMDFVRAHPPFDRLSAGEIERIEEAVETVYVARGERILDRAGAPSAHLHMIRKGSVLLTRDGQALHLLEAGDVFGYPSMLGRSSPTADAIAEEDTLLYRIPEKVFRALMENPAFAEFFVLGLASRLKRAASVDPSPLAGNLSGA